MSSLPDTKPAFTGDPQPVPHRFSAPGRVPRTARLQFEPVVSPARWAAACRASAQPVTPFHSYAFLSVAARLTGRQFRPLVVRCAGADVGVVPWLVKSRGPVNAVTELPFPYVGPLVPRELFGACLADLWRYGVRSRAVSQELQFPPGVDVDPVVLRASGFRVRTDSTFVLDTRLGIDALWEGMDRETRRKIRKTGRDGVELSEAGTGNETLMDVMDALFARQGPLGYAQPFRLRVEELDRLGLETHCVIATRDGVRLGSLLTLLYEGRALGWVGGVLAEHRSTNANLAMYWEAIRWAHERSALSLDMVGAPNAGIGGFKKQFGGQLQEYPVLNRAVPGLVQLEVAAERAKAVRARRV